MSARPYRPKVILLVQLEDGSVQALAGVADDIEIARDRDIYETPWSADRYPGEWTTTAKVTWTGAVTFSHVVNFDDVPDDPTQRQLRNRRELEA